MSENVDSRLVERFVSERVKHGHDDARPPISGGSDGGGPHMPDMEVLRARVDGLDSRLGGLEKRLDRIDTRLDGIDTRLRNVELNLSNIGGRLDLIVAQMPRWYQAPLSAGALVALLLAAMGLASHFHLLTP